MNAAKSERSEPAAVAGSKTTAATVLAALLLVFQLSLITHGLASNPLPGSGFGLPVAENPEFEHPHLVPPDFMLDAGMPRQPGRRYGIEYGSYPARHESHSSYTDIRAPPGLSRHRPELHRTFR